MAKILVVGGAGYIGSHMVKQLLDEAYEVIIIDNLSTGHRRLVTGGELVQGNLGDRHLLDSIFTSNDIEAVMHFAALSHVAESVQYPLAYYANNVTETVTLIDTMIRHKVKRLIFSSTASVYGEPGSIPIVEAHSCRPTHPYGVSKWCVERLLSDCDTAYGLKSICLRYFNAAGADASGCIGELHIPETHLIPVVLRSALTGKSVQLFGTDYPTPDGTCVRDYVHVTDIAQAHFLALRALMDGAGSDIYNLGTNLGYSVRQVVDLAGKITGKTISVIEDARRPGDPAILVASSEKIKRDLDWRPIYEDLQSIIKTAWKWHSGQSPKRDHKEYPADETRPISCWRN